MRSVFILHVHMKLSKLFKIYFNSRCLRLLTLKKPDVSLEREKNSRLRRWFSWPSHAFFFIVLQLTVRWTGYVMVVWQSLGTARRFCKDITKEAYLHKLSWLVFLPFPFSFLFLSSSSSQSCHPKFWPFVQTLCLCFFCLCRHPHRTSYRISLMLRIPVAVHTFHTPHSTVYH